MIAKDTSNSDIALRGVTETLQDTLWTFQRTTGLSTGVNTLQQNTIAAVTVAVTDIQNTPVVPDAAGGLPLQVSGVSAVESPSKQIDRTYSEVSVSFTPNSFDTNFGSVNIWFTGYQGSAVPTLMASGTTSPVTFLVESTGETVTVTVQAVSSTGLVADIAFSPTTTVALDGVISAPPAPTVTQNLLATPTGYQFQFGYEGGLLADVIQSYNIYRYTSNSSGSAVVVKNVPQPATNTGSYTYQETVVKGTNYYYWVSSVNTSGLESALVAAQSGLVANNCQIDSNGDLDPTTGLLAKGSTPNTTGTGFTYTSTTTTITINWTGLTLFRSDGTTTTIASGSQQITGLTANTTYYFYPTYNEATTSLVFVAAADVPTLVNIVGTKFTTTTAGYVSSTTSGTPSGTSLSTEFLIKFTYAGGFSIVEHTSQQTGTATTVNISVECSGSGSIRFGKRPSGGTITPFLVASGPYNDGKWHHVVCNYTGTTGTIYVDGVSVATGTVATASYVSGYWRVSSNQSGTTPSGANQAVGDETITDVAIYDGTVLTAIQATADYNAITAGTQAGFEAAVLANSGLTYFWKLTEPSGTSAADSKGSNTGTYQSTFTLNQSSKIANVIGTPAIAWQEKTYPVAQTQGLQGNVALASGAMALATTASGTGGGTGAGGAGGGKHIL